MYCLTPLATNLEIYSSGLFLLVALLVFKKDKKLSLVAIIIGILSLLPHLYLSNKLFLYGDFLSTVLLSLYLFFAYKDLVILKKIYMLVFVACLLAFTYYFEMWPTYYLAVIFPIIALANQYKKEITNRLLFLFTLSVVCLFVNTLVCYETLPSGLHFVTHIINALIIFLVALQMRLSAYPKKVKEEPIKSSADLLG